MNSSQIAQVLSIMLEVNDSLSEEEKYKIPTLLFWGPQGCGKTVSHFLFGKKTGLSIIPIPAGECSSAGDIIGMPEIYKEWERILMLYLEAQLSGKVTGKVEGEIKQAIASIKKSDHTVFKVPSYFPREGRGIILFDEPNRAEKDILACLHTILQFKTIFLSDYKLPPGYITSAAANPPTKEFQTNILSQSLMDRFLHIKIESDPKSSLRHFRENNFSEEVVGFFEVHQDLINPDSKDMDWRFLKQIKPSERAIEFLSNLYRSKTFRNSNKSFQLEMIQGLIGQSATLYFKWQSENYQGPLSSKAIFGKHKTQKGSKIFDSSFPVIERKFKNLAEKPDALTKTIDGITEYLRSKRIDKSQYNRFNKLLELMPMEFQIKTLIQVCNFGIEGEGKVFQKFLDGNDKFCKDVAEKIQGHKKLVNDIITQTEKKEKAEKKEKEEKKAKKEEAKKK